MMRSAICSTVFRLALAILGMVAAGLSGVRGADPLEERITKLIDSDRYRPSLWGILVVDRERGDTLWQRNPDKMFAPASVTKLFSTAAAWDAFGPEHRFTTQLFRRGEVKAGVLRGDLILKANGDLTLGGRTNANGSIDFRNGDHTYSNFYDTAEITAPDPLHGLDDLAAQIADSKIRRIEGEILIDDTLFDHSTGSGSGPSLLTPFMVNDNLIDLVITPTTPGQPAKVTWRPESSAVQVDAQIKTGSADSKPETWIRGTSLADITISGSIPAGHKPLVRFFEVPQPARFGRTLLIEALRRAGVSTSASPDSLPPLQVRLPTAKDYDGLPAIAKLESPRFAEEVKLVLKVSHNLHASTLPLLLAQKHGKRTLEEGLSLQADFLKKAEIDLDSVSFAGGAGGTSADFVTPQATVRLLNHMAAQPSFPAFRQALPILGVDGTLAKAPADLQVKGKVQAKTGTLVWRDTLNRRYLLAAKGLAGYLTTASGREVTFAFFVNRVHVDKHTDGEAVGHDLMRLCEILYDEVK